MELTFFTIIAALIVCISYQPTREFNPNFLCLDNCINLRGIMAVGIILCHVLLEIPQPELGLSRIFLHCGYLFVSVFFLLSGYGCAIQYLRHGTAYFKRMPQKIVYLSILYILSNLLFLFIQQLRKEGVSLVEFVFNQPYLGTTWYLIMQVFMYVLFWISCILCKRVVGGVIFVFITLLLTSIILKCADAHVMWYYSNMSFAVGLYIGFFSLQVNNWLKGRFVFLSVLLSFLFCIISFSDVIVSRLFEIVCVHEIRHASRMFSTVIFSVLILCVLSHLHSNKGLWRFIGNHSLEIYLLHAPIYFLLRSSIVFIHDSLYYVIAVIVLSIIIAIPAKYLNDHIYVLIGKFL